MHWSTRTRNITWYLLAYVLSQSACHSAYFHICPIEVFTPRSPLQPILLRTFHIWDYLVHRQTMLSLNVTSQVLPKSELVKMLCRLPGVFCYFFLPAERKKIWKKPKQCFISGGKKYVSNIPSGQVSYFQKPRVSVAVSAWGQERSGLLQNYTDKTHWDTQC